MTAQWSRQSPQFFELGDLPERRIEQPEPFVDAMGRLVSRDDETGAATLKLCLPAGWTLPRSAADGALELIVLEGELIVGVESVGAGGVATLPQGTAASVASPSGAETLVFWNPAPRPSEPAGPRVTSIWREPWQQGRLTGLPFGRMFKSLRLPDATEGAVQGGPNGCLRLTQWLAGYAAPQEHVHGVWEELIFLAGDWLVPERDGVAHGGSYLGNPAGLWHGPVVTARGVLAIVHSTEQLDLTQRDRDGADELVTRYLEGGSLQVPSS